MMNDLISRQAAIDIIEAGRLTKLIDAETAVNGLKGLPSVHPEQRWIPCSERLPKPGYCITSNEYNGVSEDFYYDGHFWNADKNAYEVIAWMPLPEPYAERRTDG